MRNMEKTLSYKVNLSWESKVIYFNGHPLETKWLLRISALQDKKRWLLGNVRWEIRLSPHLSEFLRFAAMNLAAVQADEFCCLFKQWFAVSHLAFLGIVALSNRGSWDRSCPTVALPSMKPQRTASFLKDEGCGPHLLLILVGMGAPLHPAACGWLCETRVGEGAWGIVLGDC